MKSKSERMEASDLPAELRGSVPRESESNVDKKNNNKEYRNKDIVLSRTICQMLILLANSEEGRDVVQECIP
jgi:hypothetical protein